MSRVEVFSTVVSAATEAAAAAETARALGPAIARGALRGGMVYTSVGYDLARLQAELKRALPGVPFIGATSCNGVGVSGAGFAESRTLVGLWLLGDGFHFGVAGARKQGRADALGAELTRAALKQAGIAASAARFAVVHGTPGDEEKVLSGLYSVLPAKTALIGGSAADNDLTGRWYVWSSEYAGSDGVVLAVCDWPWKLAVQYAGSQFPTKHAGIITAARGRSLIAIDGRPAAEVYDEWLGGKLQRHLKTGGNILAETTLSPLGVPRKVGWTTSYLLRHPERITQPDRAIQLFADVNEGDQVVLMEVARPTLVQHAGRLAEFAIGSSGLRASDVIGGLLVYCAGCLLAIGDDRRDLLARFADAVPKAQFAALFPYGEQGTVLSQPAHGNLMTSVLLLTTQPTG